MQIIIVLMAAFILMLAGPIFGAALYYKTRKGTVLHINQGRVRDARYFGKSFASMVEKNLESIQGNTITLSRKEKFFDADRQKDYRDCMEELVICQKKEFTPPGTVREFHKEIYSGENAILSKEGLKIRAAYCNKKMILGSGTEVVRWVDAKETLAIYDDCDLGISASAGEQMSIGVNCRFRRLYAPQIRLGQYSDSTLEAEEGKDPRIFRLPIQTNKEKNMRYISKEMINEDGVVDFSVLSWRNVTVTEKIIIQGDVRSHKGVRLCDDAVVCGNIFAEEDVLLGKNATVLGNIFTQGSIYFEERATAGQKGRISSVIARDNITFEKDNFVFGYVSCEKEGRVGSVRETEADGKQKRKVHKLEFLDRPYYLERLTFKDLYDFEHVDQQGFRKEPMLREVEIPEGAQKIEGSMFFDCENLESIKLPETIRKIEAYAFADCYKLKDLQGFEKAQVEEVGISAFERCKSLESIAFSAALLNLEGAVFGGCDHLTSVIFPEDSRLLRVGDHCFSGCSRLEEIELPDTVTYVGISAFRGCDSLRKIIVPISCQEEPGIAELPEMYPEVELVFKEPVVTEEVTGNTTGKLPEADGDKMEENK